MRPIINYLIKPEIASLLIRATPVFIEALEKAVGLGIYSNDLLKAGHSKEKAFNGLNACREASVILEELLKKSEHKNFTRVMDESGEKHSFLVQHSPSHKQNDSSLIIVDGTWKQIFSVSAMDAIFYYVTLTGNEEVKKAAAKHINQNTITDQNIAWQLREAVAQEKVIFYGTLKELTSKITELTEIKQRAYKFPNIVAEAMLSETLSFWKGTAQTYKNQESTPSTILNNARMTEALKLVATHKLPEI